MNGRYRRQNKATPHKIKRTSARARRSTEKEKAPVERRLLEQEGGAVRVGGDPTFEPEEVELCQDQESVHPPVVRRLEMRDEREGTSHRPTS